MNILTFPKKTLAYCNRVANGDSHFTNEVLEYIKQWLVNHIQVTDKKYIDCFKRNGLKINFQKFTSSFFYSKPSTILTKVLVCYHSS